jgi:hypothetical protein
MKIIYLKKFWTGAITLYPFMFIKERYRGNEEFIAHEAIHIEQQKELLVIPFYLIYLLEWLFKLLFTFDSNRAYKSISFEQEAYHHEDDITYYKTRKRYSSFKYLFKLS